MKYNIENNIDFYSQLYTSLDDSKNNDDTGFGENEYCLISNLPLINNFVKLKCGHKFNYAPLYKDIFNHKKKFNNMEQIQTKLKQNQIRCPYCRNVQDELLPYYENLGFPKQNGVNFYDINKSVNKFSDFIDPNNQCQYQVLALDASANTHTHQCHHYGYIHPLLKMKYNDETKYCYTHKLVVLKDVRDKLKEKIKMEKIQEKAKKIEEKNKLKMELVKNKAKKAADCDDVDAENIKYCEEILKSGKNKGICCYSKIYKDSLCRRHFNVKNKQCEIIDKDSEENIVIG